MCDYIFLLMGEVNYKEMKLLLWHVIFKILSSTMIFPELQKKTETFKPPHVSSWSAKDMSQVYVVSGRPSQTGSKEAFSERCKGDMLASPHVFCGWYFCGGPLLSK